MNMYELLYIIDNSATDEAKEALVAKFSDLITNNGGTVDSVDKWGTKRLAYPINYKNDGYYVLVNFSAEPTLPLEMERVMGITEGIIRYMILKK